MLEQLIPSLNLNDSEQQKITDALESGKDVKVLILNCANGVGPMLQALTQQGPPRFILTRAAYECEQLAIKEPDKAEKWTKMARFLWSIIAMAAAGINVDPSILEDDDQPRIVTS